jgi:hypothetical protein
MLGRLCQIGRPHCAGAPQWPGYDDQKDAAMNFSVPNSGTSGFDAQIYDLRKNRC